MEHQAILQNIYKHINLTPEESAIFVGYLEGRTLKKRQFLTRGGKVFRNSAFVKSGCLRGFNIDKNGFEHVLSLAPENWWMGDLYSTITGNPGMLHIQAIEDCELWLLSRENQEELFLKVPKFERFFRILIEHSLVAHQQRISDNMSHTAEERYELFCAKYPMLKNRLPNKYIASYIGVTPEFFSKMKNKSFHRLHKGVNS
jgi:CRP/FNR family transcriptional regulator, anaerobic regulatory protein